MSHFVLPSVQPRGKTRVDMFKVMFIAMKCVCGSGADTISEAQEPRGRRHIF